MYFAELKGMQKDEATSSINKWAKELKVEEYLQMPAEKIIKRKSAENTIHDCNYTRSRVSGIR